MKYLLLLLLIVSQPIVCLAQINTTQSPTELETLLPALEPPHEPTTKEDVIDRNPIKLQISITDDIPTISKPMSLYEAVQIGLQYSPTVKSAEPGSISARRLSRA